MPFILSVPKRPGLHSGAKDASCPVSLVAQVWYQLKARRLSCWFPRVTRRWHSLKTYVRVSVGTKDSVFHTEVKRSEAELEEDQILQKTIIHILKTLTVPGCISLGGL